MIDDLYDDARQVWQRLTPAEQDTMEDVCREADVMRGGGWPAPRRPQDRFPIFDVPNLRALVRQFGDRSRSISMSAYDGWRPYPARKPPLAAPVPGLPDRAPPLPPELADKLP